jgi:hypothetical protein
MTLFEDLRKTIKGYSGLKKNWDGYNADPVEQKSVDNTLKLLTLFEKFVNENQKEYKEDVFSLAHGDGTVGLVFRHKHYKTKETFELYCHLNSTYTEGITVTGLVTNPKTITEELPEKQISFDELPVYFEWFLSKQQKL